VYRRRRAVCRSEGKQSLEAGTTIICCDRVCVMMFCLMSSRLITSSRVQLTIDRCFRGGKASSKRRRQAVDAVKVCDCARACRRTHACTHRTHTYAHLNPPPPQALLASDCPLESLSMRGGKAGAALQADLVDLLCVSDGVVHASHSCHVIIA
jgi:hypothetical protein